MMNEASERVQSLTLHPPLGTPDYDAWIRQESFIAFLKENAAADQLVLFASAPPHLFVHGVVLPQDSLTEDPVPDLLNWHCDPWTSWGISYSIGADADASLDHPLHSSGSQILERGEQIVFLRSFEGRTENPTYVELLQKLTHSFGLHFVPERSAYCRFNRSGDIEDIIRIIELPQATYGEFRVVQIDRRVFDEYLAITRSVYVCLFDSTRYTSGHFSGWNDQTLEHVEDKAAQLYFDMGRVATDASYVRGFQLITSPMSIQELIRRFHDGDEESEYATFIAFDFKHDRIAECSCDPKELANYFVRSELPFELSPVFFSADVLARYKADTEKYKVTDRSITCRGGWHLEHYDVNDVGQVHSYLIDLGRLPYKEQLYWKACNEVPKGPISRRSYESHFLGEWYSDDDPLRDLRDLLRELERDRVPWWTLRADDLMDKAHYPLTEGADEWAREIGALDKLLNEGFDSKRLRARAESLGRVIQPQWRSLKLIEETLQGLGHPPEEASRIVAPFRELSDLRSTTTAAHATGREAKAKRAKLLKKHGTFQEHYRYLCKASRDSLLRLGTIL